MSRPTNARSLTLTEELERLEQQITLTLQEIDSNFSKAHRIVTSSILPIVEQYGKHSNDVWESSKFWKQFFEASANVSLSGYEEAALDDQDATHTALEETTTQLETPQSERQAYHGHQSDEQDDSYTIESPTQVTGVHSTPKLPPSNSKARATHHKSSSGKPTSSAFRSPSPRKYTGHNPLATSQSSAGGPSTPKPFASNTQDLFDSSPFQPESAAGPTPNPDTVLHRNVLDKNYRIQATPHSQRKQPPSYSRPTTTTPGTATRTQRQPWDDSPGSSPEISAPQLRSELFSPAKTRPPQQSYQYQPQPLTPGVSVLTPAKPNSHAAATRITSTGRPLSSPPSARNRASRLFAADSSDEDDSFVMSPPKTMQFHVPQSRLLQTPAREASRKIVEDLLMTAGADATDEIEGDGEHWEEPSPSVVRKAWDEDDTF